MVASIGHGKMDLRGRMQGGSGTGVKVIWSGNSEAQDPEYTCPECEMGKHELYRCMFPFASIIPGHAVRTAARGR